MRREEAARHDEQACITLQRRIIRRLRSAGPSGLSRSELYRMLSRPITKAALDDALTKIKGQGMARERRIETSFPGRPKEIWQLTEASCVDNEKNSDVRHVTFIVMEPGCDHVAIVTADICDVDGNASREEYCATEAGFVESLRRAVTRWADTPAGRRAVGQTHGQLTIETLASYLDVPLSLMLAAVGINNLVITPISANASGKWHLADLLYAPGVTGACKSTPQSAL